jgi:hypothetical protein
MSFAPTVFDIDQRINPPPALAGEQGACREAVGGRGGLLGTINFSNGCPGSNWYYLVQTLLAQVAMNDVVAPSVR